ncbi:MAG: DNA-directed RNA polymerase subunit delta [Bacilli bacterium]
MEKTLLDYAEEFLRNNETEASFNDIWAYVCENALNINEEDDLAKKIIARFYTNLSLDGRFVPLENSMWDLRARKKFDDIKRDWKEYYPEEGETDIDVEDDEQREYESVYGENTDRLNGDDDDENKSEDDDEFNDHVDEEC